MRVPLIAALAASALVFVATTTSPHPQQKYPWQHSDGNCNETTTFCWYGVEDSSKPEVTAYGNRWTTQDKDEKGFEWVTEVRCVKDSKLCILARNQKAMNGGSQTNIDLYRIEEWGKVQIRAIGENLFVPGKECEFDTLILNRVEGSVSMLSAPGPGAATKVCMGPGGIIKPKTVVYKLEIGPPKFADRAASTRYSGPAV
jgi:hypothetical protein